MTASWSGADNETWYWRGIVNDAAGTVTWPTGPVQMSPSVNVNISNVIEAQGQNVYIVMGYLFGNISHARVLFNHTLRDAKRIKEEVQKLSKLDEQVMGALVASRRRNPDPTAYDPELVNDLKQVQDSALANPLAAKRIEDSLFRTIYAMMDDLLINQLFNYFNNSMRLIGAVSA